MIHHAYSHLVGDRLTIGVGDDVVIGEDVSVLRHDESRALSTRWTRLLGDFELTEEVFHSGRNVLRRLCAAALRVARGSRRTEHFDRYDGRSDVVRDRYECVARFGDWLDLSRARTALRESELGPVHS